MDAGLRRLTNKDRSRAAATYPVLETHTAMCATRSVARDRETSNHRALTILPLSGFVQQSDQVVRCAHSGVQAAARFARRLSQPLYGMLDVGARIADSHNDQRLTRVT